MSLDKDLINQLVKVTSRAAINCYQFLGKENKKIADKAATDSMRKDLNNLEINGEVVIGEGELDEAPMLYIGEKLGKGNGPYLDIAVDPLEGTNFAAKNIPGAISVLAISEKGNLFNAPETYMNKISANVNEKNVVDLDFSIKKNISNLSEFKNKKPNELTACLLDRPRHKRIIEELKNLGVKLKLLTDGDVSGALLVSKESYNIDIFLGIGGGPEGVLAASALDSLGCFFQGRFIFETENDKKRAKKMGIEDFDKKYELNEIVSGDSLFCATGITTGDLVSGIELNNDHFISETLITHKSSKLQKIFKTKYII